MEDSGSSTSEFGRSKRENHDSSKFYNQPVYEDMDRGLANVNYEKNSVSEDVIDSVHQTNSRDMDLLPDQSVHLMITSPPYVAAKEYDQEWTLDEYIDLLVDVFNETHRVLVPGGRACVNIANIGRSPYIPLHSYIIQSMLDIGYLMRGEIIWDKGASVGTSTAWGSWKSASNPCLRDEHEYILIFSKQTFGRDKGQLTDSIDKEQFLEYTKSIWEFQTASAEDVGHPAPFPEELPERLIELYSFQGDVVLDPFVGCGTTCVACKNTNRQFVGLEKEEEYVCQAKDRLSEVTSNQ